jgi:hypothetical protein
VSAKVAVERFSAEYIDACRILGLPRRPRFGDIFYDGVEQKAAVHTDQSGNCYEGGGFSAGMYGGEWFWLPTEGDLLDRLEAEGEAAIIGIRPAKDGSGYGVQTDEGDDSEVAFGHDRKTALIRLLAAVLAVEL